MENRFFEPSAKLQTSQFEASTLWAYIKPFMEDCPPEKSFAIKHSDTEFTETQLRSLVSRKGKAMHKKFRVVKHLVEGEALYEVGRLEGRNFQTDDETFKGSEEVTQNEART